MTPEEHLRLAKQVIGIIRSNIPFGSNDPRLEKIIDAIEKYDIAVGNSYAHPPKS